MGKIYIEVPRNTDQTTISIPCGEKGQVLWQFTVIFIENEYLKKLLVTVMDNNCEDGGEPSIQSMMITNKNNRTATFEYHLDQDIKADIKLSVYFCKSCRMIIAEW